MPLSLNLDPPAQTRLNRVAAARNCSAEAILSEALAEYLEGKEISKDISEDRHPSGKPWPKRNPVGGIITPV